MEQSITPLPLRKKLSDFIHDTSFEKLQPKHHSSRQALPPRSDWGEHRRRLPKSRIHRAKPYPGDERMRRGHSLGVRP